MNLLDLLDSPQVGEYAFNQVTADPGIADVSERHYARLRDLAAEASADDGRPARVLEVGAYRHFSGHLLAERDGAEVVLTDISARALEVGRMLGVEAGASSVADICAADFHRLPFADRYFDVVFIASAIHHSRSPELVIRELMRVLRPGGLLWVDNEPAGREFCAYRFAGNRPEGFTAFERGLQDAGLLATVSSPFIGARPEALFGMVENDRIALDLYLDEFSRDGRIEHLVLDHRQTSSEFERGLLETEGRSEDEIAGSVFRACTTRVADLDSSLGPIDRALGFSLPGGAEWWVLARRMAAAIQTVRRTRDHAESDRVLARLFGAALQARVRKAGRPGPRAEGRFSRPMIRRGHCWVEAPESSHALLALEPMLPDVFDAAQRPDVEALFGPRGFAVVEEDFGANSLMNIVPSPSLDFDPASESALLVVRAYAIARGDPYLLVVRQGHRLLGQALIAQSESHLFKGVIHRGAGAIVIESLDPEGRPRGLVEQLRIGVFQILAAVQEPTVLAEPA